MKPQLTLVTNLMTVLLFGATAPQALSQVGAPMPERAALHPHLLRAHGDAGRDVASKRAQPPDEVTVVYEDGLIATGDSTRGLGLWRLANPGFQYANRYDVPENGTLTRVAVTPYYDNVFTKSELPLDAPRDFTLKVWNTAVDNSVMTGEETLVPGEELFSLVVVDSARAYPPKVPEITFLEVDLTAYQDQLSDLPEEVFIGLANAGEDANYIALGVSEYEDENVSYLYFPGNQTPIWLPFPEITNQGVHILVDRVIPIRPTFRIAEPGETGQQPTAAEEGEDLPTHLELDPNYPNPFNPTTTIAYRLPQTSEVRLTVYDVLGRPVATLLDGVEQGPGRHALTVDATGWASGVYFYAIEAAGQRRTGTMTLSK